MHRISVTTLEKFRRYMAGTSSFDTEQALIESMDGTFTGNDKTRFGSAFHKLIEEPKYNAGPFELKEVPVDGTKVGVPDYIADIAIRYAARHPHMTCEIPVGKMYNTAKGSIWVGGRIDAIEGMHIRDAKTKYRAPSVTEYQDSCQWKYYLDIIGLKVFWYDIFEIKFFDGLAQAGSLYYPLVTTGRDKQPRKLQVVEHEPIPCYGYLGMHKDCTGLVEQFLEWVSFRKLTHLLKPYEKPVLISDDSPTVVDLWGEAVLTGKQCPYCGRKTEFIDSAVVYGKSYGMIYSCHSCEAWVGVHESTEKALGRLANAELRDWKKKAHAAFDPIWKPPARLDRTSAYKWLSVQLNIPLDRTHIGMFDVDLCKKTVDACKAIAPRKVPA